MRRAYKIILACLLSLFFFTAAAEGTAVKTIVLKSSKVTIGIGQIKQLTIKKLKPEGASVIWSSSDDNVATVSQDGTVTGKKEGKTVITVCGTNGKKDECEVTVKRYSIKKIKFDDKSYAIHPGKTTVLSYTITPSNATDKTLQWTSSDPTKVKVEADGTMYALAYTDSPVTITAQAMDGSGAKASCLVTVRDVSVKKIKLGKKSLTIALGGSETLFAKALPETAGNTALSWESEDPSIAAVDQTGLVTAKAEGKTKIIVKAADGSGVTASCTVKVKTVPVKSVKITNQTMVLEKGDTESIQYTVKPENASYKEVQWSSSDPTVAKVDENGTVTALKGGIATITAAAIKDKASDKIKVYVKGDNLQKVTISAAGDIALGGDPRNASKSKDPESTLRFAELARKNGGINGCFDGVSAVFENDDISIANLECVLTDKTSFATKSICIIGNPSYAVALKNAGIDVVSTVNNHYMDAYKDGYTDTLRALKRAGVLAAKNEKYVSVKCKGVKIGFLSFATANMIDDSYISTIRRAKASCDFLVVSIHWGVEEFVYAEPTGQQKSISHAMVRAGADLVLGTHSHRINGIEDYQGKYIVYDLGNFLTCIKNPKNKTPTDFDSFIFQISYYVFEDGTMQYDSIRVIPCAYSSSETENTGRPMVFTEQADKNRVYAKIQRYSNITIPQD